MLSEKKSIFVTGGTGFIGSYLLRYLVKQGFKNIRALKRPSSPMNLVEDISDQIEWVEGEIMNLPLLEEVMAGMQQVYHCAGMISFSRRERDRMFKINEEGTANLVNLLLDFGVEKMVHVSSIAALGRVKNGDTISETSKWQNSKLNSNYAISKYLAEMQVWRGIEEGLNAVIVNPSLVLGSGFWGQGTCEIFPTIKKGLSFFPAGATGVVDVRDVARYMIELMNSKVQRERIILSAESISYRSFFEKISKEMELNAPKFRVSAFLNGIAWRGEWLRSFFTGKEPIINRETATLTGHSFFYDSRKSLKYFDFKYTPLEQTIEETVRQFLPDFKTGKKASVLPLL